MFYQTNHMQAAERAENAVFVPGDLDLDIQTCPSEGPNMTSLWTWHKCVQRVPRDISYTNKKVTDSAKNCNLTQFTACSKY